MAAIEGWENLCKRTEVLEVRGKYYIKCFPNKLYGSRQGAEVVAKKIQDGILY